MKILITGISGLIGSRLTSVLLAQKHTVSGLTRDIVSAEKKLPKSVSLVENLEQAQDFMPDVVINLAGEPIADKRWSVKRKQALFDSRVELTRNLVDWMRTLKQMPEVFISGSAVGYYGRYREEALDENASGHDEFTHQLCKQWEAAARTLENETRVCLLRTGLVVSGSGGFLARLRLPFKLGLGGRLGDGQQYMSWIHLDDMVRAIVFLMDNHQASGVFNMTAPNPVTNQQFTQILAKQLNRPAIFPVPGWVLKTLLGEMSDLLLTGQKVVPSRLLEMGYSFSYERLEDALSAAL